MVLPRGEQIKRKIRGKSTRVSRDSDAELVLVNNRELTTLPEFEIENSRTVRLVIQDNPKLDTTQILEECMRKRCPPRIFNSIQMPFCT